SAGSTLAVAADPGTVPSGFRLRGDPEQYVLVGAAEMARASFPAEAGRIVRLEISGSAFEEGSTALKQRWRDGISELIETLSAEVSVLHVRYARRDALAETRLRSVADAVQRQWRQSGQPWPLAIHTEITE